MFIDSYKTLVMEHCGYPGNIGDSCAETSRYKHLKDLLGEDSSDVDLYPFVSEKGFLRHPTAPERDDKGVSWREVDFTSDQGLPLYEAAKYGYKDIAFKLRMSIENSGWKTGNGDLVHPIFYGILTDQQWIINLCTFGQGILFKMPWRWNEAYNRFEELEESSADFLNYIHAGVYAHPICRKIISNKLLKEKVRQYYSVEPNKEFLISLYDRVIDKYWS